VNIRAERLRKAQRNYVKAANEAEFDRDSLLDEVEADSKWFMSKFKEWLRSQARAEAALVAYLEALSERE
jgi:hypothetical protein